jgi:integrase
MGVDDAARVTSLTLRRWFQGHLGTDRERNAVQILGRLARLFRWLVQERRMPANPADGIKPPKLPPRLRKRFLTREQADRLIATCADQRLKFALFCALHAGMRKGEIVASRPDWFDLTAGLLHIQNTEDWLVKDRTDRTVPLTAAFREFLAGYGLPSPYMLPSGKAGKNDNRRRQRPKRGQPAPTTRYRYDFRRPFAEHMKACGLEGFTFHDLRRTFASLLVSSGVSIYKVAKWLGDGVAVVEMRYGHLIPLDEDINAAWN